VAWWRIVVGASDLQPIGRRFESRSLRFTNDLGQVIHTHVPLLIKQYKLVPAKGRWCSMAGKVTLGLASHWPYVTDSVVYPCTYGLNGLGKGDEHPPTLHWSTTASLPMQCFKMLLSLFAPNLVNIVLYRCHKNYFHQMLDFSFKMHQIQFCLGLCPRPRWGAHNSLRPPSWI